MEVFVPVPLHRTCQIHLSVHVPGFIRVHSLSKSCFSDLDFSHPLLLSYSNTNGTMMQQADTDR